jgi:RNA-directed DNA polymerase
MTARPKWAAGAASRKPETEIQWDEILWDDVEAQVRRLQERIVKATREQRWSKVKSYNTC